MNNRRCKLLKHYVRKMTSFSIGLLIRWNVYKWDVWIHNRYDWCAVFFPWHTFTSFNIPPTHAWIVNYRSLQYRISSATLNTADSHKDRNTTPSTKSNFAIMLSSRHVIIHMLGIWRGVFSYSVAGPWEFGGKLWARCVQSPVCWRLLYPFP